MRFLRFIVLTTLLLVGFSSVVFGELGGSLQWDYGHYSAEEGGVEQADMTHFAQKYALNFSRSGTFMDGRAGKYEVMVGGEWIAVNSDITISGVDNGYDVSTGKLLYLGNIRFAPGGLPFQFNAYARDVSRTRFQESTPFMAGLFDENYLAPNKREILTSGIIDDIIDGTRFESGASMIVGIKNGSYLGRYRNILSHLPKLYVDYRELRVKDFESRTPEFYVDRELAFVSLNKKHNWFHYRFYDHADKWDPSLSFEVKSYMLGTVDNLMHREWINLTNWIQLSVDGSLTYEDNAESFKFDENRYALNMFAKTEREDWSSAVLSRFWRTEQIGGDLGRHLEVPVYAYGQPNKDNAWRARFVGWAERINKPFAVVNTATDEDVLYSKLRWETHKTRENVAAPELSAEKKYGDKGDGWATRAAFEYFSNPDKVKNRSFFSGLSLTYFEGSPEFASGVLPTLTETRLVEADGRLDMSWRHTPRFRTGFESSILIGSGQAEGDVTDYIRPKSREVLFASTNVGNSAYLIDGSVWRGRFMLFADHVSDTRFENRYELAGEYRDDSNEAAGQFQVRHRLRYNKDAYVLNVLNEFLIGDKLSRSVNSRVFNAVLAGADFDGYSLTHESNLGYTPNRNHRLGGKATIDYRKENGLGSGYRLALQQDYRYTRYAEYGIQRRVLELSELLDYERLDPAGSDFFEAVAVVGMANYYPMAWLRLGSKVRWQNNIDLGSNDIGCGLYTDFMFSKLDIGLEYEYGLRNADDTGSLVDRNEQRWRVSIKKTF